MGQWLKEGVTDMRPTLSRKENMSYNLVEIRDISILTFKCMHRR